MVKIYLTMYHDEYIMKMKLLNMVNERGESNETARNQNRSAAAKR